MEDAYSLAMEIADKLSRKRFFEYLEKLEKEKYNNLEWPEIQKIIEAEKLNFIFLKEGHQNIFLVAYEVLQKA